MSSKAVFGPVEVTCQACGKKFTAAANRIEEVLAHHTWSDHDPTARVDVTDGVPLTGPKS
jgi:hypothetical protein